MRGFASRGHAYLDGDAHPDQRPVVVRRHENPCTYCYENAHTHSDQDAHAYAYQYVHPAVSYRHVSAATLSFAGTIADEPVSHTVIDAGRTDCHIDASATHGDSHASAADSDEYTGSIAYQHPATGLSVARTDGDGRVSLVGSAMHHERRGSAVV